MTIYGMLYVIVLPYNSQIRGRPLIRTVFSICTTCKSGWVGGFEMIGRASKKPEKIA